MKIFKSFNFYEKIFILYVLILGLILIFFIPPFQKPDEYVHFDKAVAISHGELFCSQNNFSTTKTGYKQLQQSIINLLIEFKPDSRYPWRNNIKPIFSTNEEYKDIQIDKKSYCSLPFISYIPQAIGIKLGEVFHLNSIYIFFLGRLAIFVLCFFWFILLFKKTPQQLKPIVIFMFSLPVVIFQITSYSYDAIQIMIGFSIFSYLFSLLVQKSKISDYQLGKFFLLILLFLFTKTGGYEMFLFLPLMFPIPQISKSRGGYIKKILFFYTILFILLISAKFIITNKIITDNTGPAYVYPLQQLHQIIDHPSTFFKVLSNTTSKYFDFYIRNLIGIFGWLDMELPVYIYYLFALFLGIIISKLSKIKQILNLKQIIILSTIVIFTYTEIILAMYLMWTPVGYSTSIGVQGRYFITIIPFLILVLSYLLKRIMNNKNLAILITAFLGIIIIFNSIYHRYYDYSKLLENYNQRLITNESSVEIDKKIYKITNYDSTKKIGAVIIYSNIKKDTVLKPYTISIKDRECQKEYRREFIDLVSISENKIITYITPIKIKDQKDLCIEISSYGDVSGKSLSIYKDSDEQYLIDLVYLR